MRQSAFALIAACCFFISCASEGTPKISSSQIAAAIAAPVRTDNDRSLDASRKPAEFLQFLALRDGDKVAEINAGAGYNARLLALAVGSKGRVYASNAEFVLELFDGLNDRLSASVAGIPNVQVSTQKNTRLDLPEAVDLAILNNNYHDLHWQNIDTAAFNRSVYNALRPGGYFVIGDHRAVSGSGIEHVGTLHRIDRDVVITELISAGFVLVDSAEFLANPNDDRTTFVIDPEIRGKTDRFLLKFRRPE